MAAPQLVFPISRDCLLESLYECLLFTDAFNEKAKRWKNYIPKTRRGDPEIKPDNVLIQLYRVVKKWHNF